MVIFFLAAAFVAGALVILQSNARLKDGFGHPLSAIVVSSALGLLLLLGVLAALRVSPPPLHRLAELPWWAWAGGLLGAIYAVTVILLARPLGAATLTALVVTGQLMCSVVLDHFGLIDFEVHRATVGRLFGCLLLLAGTFLIWKF